MIVKEYKVFGFKLRTSAKPRFDSVGKKLTLNRSVGFSLVALASTLHSQGEDGQSVTFVHNL